MTSRLITLMLSLVLFTAAVAHAGTQPGISRENLASEQVLHRGNFLEPESLDPHRARGAEAANILRDLYEGLTREGPAGETLPGAAKSWEISNDGLRYVFYLREDARWSNGEAVTADDFVAGMRRTADPAMASSYIGSLKIFINGADIITGKKPVDTLGVKALDAKTLEIRLEAPAPYLLDMLSHHSLYPIHRASLEKYGEQLTRPGNLISNGAYRLSEWRVNDRIRLDRNTHYWDNDAVIINTVYYYPLDDENSEFNRFRAGELDATQTIPVRQFAQLKTEFADALRIASYLSTYYYGFNLSREPFKHSPGLRRALSMVIDRAVLAEKVMGIGELPAWSVTPPGIRDYDAPKPDYADWPMEKRIAEAKRLYREAGYSEENPLKTELRYNTGDNHKRVALAVSSMWRQHLGVQSELVHEEWRVFLQKRKQREVTQIFRGGWVGDYNDPYTFLQLFHSENPLNDYGYASAEYDALLNQAAHTADRGKRLELLRQAEVIMQRDVPVMPLYVYVSKHLVQPWVGGWQDNIMDHHATRDLYILKH